MTRIPETTGIMFTHGPDGFPTVDDIARSAWSHAMGIGFLFDSESFADWHAVARDPHAVTYFDDDAQAIDETNWDALIAALSIPADDIPSVYSALDGPTWVTECIDDAHAAGIAIVGRVLAIRPDMTADVDAMTACERSLADYPLLNEEAHSDREYNDALATLVACYDVTAEEAPEVFSFLFDTRSYCRGTEYRADDVNHALTALGFRWECVECGDMTDDESDMRGDRCKWCEANRVDAWLWAACAS